jgi:hypothetical protein
MKKMTKFTDIGQFRNVVKSIISKAQFVGMDDDGEPIFDYTLGKPTVNFSGTVKLHGSNLGVCFTHADGLWVQSRTNIITPEKDNAGSAFFVMNIQEEWQKLIDEVIRRENLDLKEDIISIFAEWCGGNIQKGVAISGLDKMAVIFAVKVTPVDDEIPSYYLNSDGLQNNKVGIYNVDQFERFSIDIDFERPDIAQNKMVKLVEKVENECPAGKFFGRTSEDVQTGEGIVWTADYKGNRFVFKTKGEKHSSSKVKTVAEVDTAKLDGIHQFVEYAVTENRLNQAIEQVFTSNDIEVDIKKTGDFLRWVIGDITKEESDTMADNGLEPKDVNKYISTKAKIWYFKYINSELGLK